MTPETPDPPPVSPVAPEPPTETECCREPIAADERFCQKCGHEARIQPAGEPAPCVWREEWVEYGNNHGRDEVKTGCGLSEDADEMRPLMKWPFCPQCGHPLTVER